MKSLSEMLNSLPEDRQERIKKRADSLIEKEWERRALRDIRKHFTRLSQSEVAARLNINQDSVSRMENREDIRLSTLACYIQALGGSLDIVVKFSGQPDYVMSGRGCWGKPAGWPDRE